MAKKNGSGNSTTTENDAIRNKSTPDSNSTDTRQTLAQAIARITAIIDKVEAIQAAKLEEFNSTITKATEAITQADADMIATFDAGDANGYAAAKSRKAEAETLIDFTKRQLAHVKELTAQEITDKNAAKLWAEYSSALDNFEADLKGRFEEISAQRLAISTEAVETAMAWNGIITRWRQAIGRKGTDGYFSYVYATEEVAKPYQDAAQICFVGST